MNIFKHIIRGAGVIAGVLLMAVQMGGCSSKCPCTNKVIKRPVSELKTNKPGAEHKSDLSVTEK